MARRRSSSARRPARRTYARTARRAAPRARASARSTRASGRGQTVRLVIQSAPPQMQQTILRAGSELVMPGAPVPRRRARF